MFKDMIMIKVQIKLVENNPKRFFESNERLAILFTYYPNIIISKY